MGAPEAADGAPISESSTWDMASTAEANSSTRPSEVVMSGLAPCSSATIRLPLMEPSTETTASEVVEVISMSNGSIDGSPEDTTDVTERASHTPDMAIRICSIMSTIWPSLLPTVISTPYLFK